MMIFLMFLAIVVVVYYASLYFLPLRRTSPWLRDARLRTSIYRLEQDVFATSVLELISQAEQTAVDEFYDHDPAHQARVRNASRGALTLNEIREQSGISPLYDEILRVYSKAPAGGTQNMHWVFSYAHFYELRNMTDGSGRLVWTPPMLVQDPKYLFGLPIEIRDGVPRPFLEPSKADKVLTRTMSPAEKFEFNRLNAQINSIDAILSGGRMVPAGQKLMREKRDKMWKQARELLEPSGACEEFVPNIGLVKAASPEDLARAVEVMKERYETAQNNAMGVMVLPQGVEYIPKQIDFPPQMITASIIDS